MTFNAEIAMPRPTVQDLATPALLVDAGKFAANIARMKHKIAPSGVIFRPHVKTTKSPEAIRALFAGHAGPITVSTILEAQRFAEAGFSDILYAVAIVPAKLAAIRTLADRGVAMGIIADNLDVALAVAAELPMGGGGIQLLIEVDCDGHRSGVAPDDGALLPIGETLAQRDLLGGVMTHAGGSYQCVGADAIAAHAELERSGLLSAATRLREAGMRCATVSMGSTPTTLFAPSFDGMTEVRAGVYMFQDLVMAGIGVCDPEEIALSVLCSVISHQGAAGQIIVDAGWMAMSRDRGTAMQAIDQGYGLVCDADGGIIGDLIVKGANQEHGLIGHRDGRPIETARYPIGSRLRILPNHACATAAQHDRYQLIGSDGAVVNCWPRFSGW